jgi:hypothetical protein
LVAQTHARARPSLMNESGPHRLDERCCWGPSHAPYATGDCRWNRRRRQPIGSQGVAPACRPDLRDGILDRALFLDCPSLPFRRCSTRLAKPHDNLRFKILRMYQPGRSVAQSKVGVNPPLIAPVSGTGTNQSSRVCSFAMTSSTIYSGTFSEKRPPRAAISRVRG